MIPDPRDSARLEWLVRNTGAFYLAGSPEWGFRIYDLRDSMTLVTDHFPSFREAIDVAMEKNP